MTDKNLTEIVCVIDRSGSMMSIAEDAIGGFNTFLEAQKNEPTDRCLFTYAQFDNKYEVIHDCKPIEDIPPLTQETFVPRGATALLDAIGRTIATVGERLSKTPEDKRPGAVVVVILTDGQENCSKEFNRGQIYQMIKKQTDQFQWEFIYLAANQDAIGEAHTLGIQTKNAANFSHDAAGARGIYGNVSKSISSYRETKTSADLSIKDSVTGKSN